MNLFVIMTLPKEIFENDNKRGILKMTKFVKLFYGDWNFPTRKTFIMEPI